MTGLEKVKPDMSGWKVEVGSGAEFELNCWPHTVADVVAWVHRIFAWFPEFDCISITFFREGPFVEPEKGEENNLTCWHYEPEEETFGYMLKWKVGDVIAYKFMEHEKLPSQICELLNSGVTKIHVNHHHGRIEKSDSEYTL
ncbi:MAG: hypothetical protein NT105_23975 [Verrucomicrobia bacterium]|nr:hypothetical protein [Verrucomicrobiota bacterium]